MDNLILIEEGDQSQWLVEMGDQMSDQSQALVETGGPSQMLTLEQSISRHLLNPELSDVCFLVGAEREKIYAHRFILAIQSEVFKSMFFGDLKEICYEISVPDLSPVGFRNLLK